MRIGTQAPIGQQDITGAQLRMESDHFGEIMGAQGAAKICKTNPVPA
jgi:hypothetical protein